MKILVGCEESQAVTIELRKLGHEAYSCDLLPCSGGHPEWHIQGDVFEVIESRKWDAGIFFPDCTYLTVSAEWCYKNQPELKSGKLVGEKRRLARISAVQFVKDLYNSNIPLVAIENPIGALSSKFRKPDQIIQPYQFGEDASKATCLWLKGLPLLTGTSDYPPRIVDGKKRWGNQTDSGQNKLGPSVDRAKMRSKTYPGIAKAMAEQWFGGSYMIQNLRVGDYFAHGTEEQYRELLTIEDYPYKALSIEYVAERCTHEGAIYVQKSTYHGSELCLSVGFGTTELPFEEFKQRAINTFKQTT